MNQQIILNDRPISYTLKTSGRSRKMRLAVHYNGDFIVTVPKHAPYNIVQNFIITKSNWILDKIDLFKKRNPNNINIFKNTRREYLKHRESARQLVRQKIEHFNKFYNFKYNKISIRNQKSRWGSCSAKGNLNFNYKIVLIPERLADYIIVHEICHLGQLNHSAKFWELVAKTVPDYKKVRRDLRLTSYAL